MEDAEFKRPIIGWKIDERCLGCFDIKTLMKSYQLCKSCYLRMFDEAKHAANSTKDAKTLLNKKYEAIEAKLESLQQQTPAFVRSDFNQTRDNMNMQRYCGWCGIYGYRKTRFCQSVLRARVKALTDLSLF